MPTSFGSLRPRTAGTGGGGTTQGAPSCGSIVIHEMHAVDVQSASLQFGLARALKICHTVRMLSGRNGTTKAQRVDIRVDSETRQLLDDLASLYRSNRSHVVRLAVAELARSHGLPVGDVGRRTEHAAGDQSLEQEDEV